MFHFLPIAVRYDGSAPAGGHGYQVHIGPMNSDARGSVRITSADPAVKPALRFNYLSTDQDRREWVEAIGVARTILSQPAMDPYNAASCRPDPACRRPSRSWTGSGATARPRCIPPAPARWAPARCRWSTRTPCGCTGSTGLRVVDASVMPYVTNGNIYAPVMMIAEKAADLILGNTPLPPVDRRSSTSRGGRRSKRTLA